MAVEEGAGGKADKRGMKRKRALSAGEHRERGKEVAFNGTDYVFNYSSKRTVLVPGWHCWRCRPQCSQALTESPVGWGLALRSQGELPWQRNGAHKPSLYPNFLCPSCHSMVFRFRSLLVLSTDYDEGPATVKLCLFYSFTV